MITWIGWLLELNKETFAQVNPLRINFGLVARFIPWEAIAQRHFSSQI